MLTKTRLIQLHLPDLRSLTSLSDWTIGWYILIDVYFICMNRVGDEFQILGLSLLKMLRPKPPGRVETTAQLWKLIQWTCLKACKKPCSVPTWKLGTFFSNMRSIHILGNESCLKTLFFLHAVVWGTLRKKSRFMFYRLHHFFSSIHL